jgi:hypothetical protein
MESGEGMKIRDTPRDTKTICQSIRDQKKQKQASHRNIRDV